jgi:hypothetical protein
MGDTILTGDKKSFKHEIFVVKPPAYHYQPAGNLETAKIVAIYRWNVND